jgi:hypothetical protein
MLFRIPSDAQAAAVSGSTGLHTSFKLRSLHHALRGMQATSRFQELLRVRLDIQELEQHICGGQSIGLIACYAFAGVWPDMPSLKMAT